MTLLLRLLLLVPIVFIPNTNHFNIPTGIPGINLTNLILLVILAVMALQPRDRYLPPSRGILTAPLIALFTVLTLAFLMVQVLSPGNIGEDVEYLKKSIFYILFYFIYRNCGQDIGYVRAMILLCMAVAAIASLEAIRQALHFGIGNYTDANRAAGPFGSNNLNANLAGVYFAIFLPMFASAVLFLRGHGLWRMAALSGSAIVGLGLMVTYSRQSYLIALVCMVVLLIRKNMALAILLGALAIPAVSLLPGSVTQRVQETEQASATGDARYDSSATSRFVIWKGAMQMWQEYPLGVGLDRFKQHIGKYTARYAGYDAHNFFVLVLSEYGPVGLGVLFWLFWRLWRLRQTVERSASEEDVEAKALAIGFTLAVVAMTLGNMYGSRLFNGTMMASFWILCGLMERYAALQRAAATTDRQLVPSAETLATEAPHRFPLAARIMPGRYPHRK